MPELSRVCDPFSDAVKAFMFGEPQTSGTLGDDERNPTQDRFCNPAIDHGHLVYKPTHFGDDHHSKVTGTASDNSPLDLDMFMRPTYYTPTENDLGRLQQPVNIFSALSDNHNYPTLQLDVPEIDECIPWIPDILEDFSVFNTPELPTMSSVGNVTFDMIAPGPSNFSPSVSIPMSHAKSTPPSTIATPSMSKNQTVLSPATPSTSRTPPLPSPATTSTSRTPKVSSPALPQPTTPPTSRTPKVSFASAVAPIPDKVLTTPVAQTLEALKPQPSRIRKTRASKKTTTPKVDQLEHVRRERKRRDDMSFKISTLESLLPPAGPNMKRDRASIVHDSVHYVRSLQQELDELKKKHAELKLSKSSERLPVSAAISSEKQIPDMVAEEKGVKLMEYHIQVEGDTESAAKLEKCRCRSDHMSRAMKVMEQLNLDVRRCTITKMYSYSMCLIMAKPRLPSSSPMSSASVVAALRSSITVE